MNRIPSFHATKRKPLHVGQKLGAGAYKKAYEIVEYPGWVALTVDKYDVDRIEDEMKDLIRLKKMGIPALKPYGIRPVKTDDGLVYGLIVKRMAGSTRGGNFYDHTNERSIKDLEKIQHLLNKHKHYVIDLQFLVGFNGEVVIADPAGVHTGDQDEDHLFEALIRDIKTRLARHDQQ